MNTLSHHVQASKLLSNEIKKNFPEIKFRKKSEFDCLNFYFLDVDPTTQGKLKEIASKYKSGHFDGLTDSYEYKPLSESFEFSVKYVFLNFEFSENFKQKCYEKFRSYFNLKDLPESYSEAVKNNCKAFDEPISRTISNLMRKNDDFSNKIIGKI